MERRIERPLGVEKKSSALTRAEKKENALRARFSMPSLSEAFLHVEPERHVSLPSASEAFSRLDGSRIRRKKSSKIEQ